MEPVTKMKKVAIWTTVTFVTCLLKSTLASEGISPPCHQTFHESSGLITSPNFPNNYPPNLHCTLDIARMSDKQCGVRLSFEVFKMELPDFDGFCKKDWLTVDSCVPEGGARFCGNVSARTYEYPFQKGAEAFRLVLRTDNKTESKGFRLAYNVLTDCRHGIYWEPPISIIPGVFPEDTPCFTQVTEKKGTINTPYFPRHYPNNMDCVYEFIRESPMICGVRMRVLTFELDNAIDTHLGGACLDFLHSPGCGFLCGTIKFVWTAKFQPAATSLKFHFHSDEKKTRPGFQIAFEQVINCP